MPRPMRVKIFMDSSASSVEAQINAWLGELGSASIIKTETALSNAAEKPCIVVTIWYELQN